jgi:hypothetical protein
LVIAPQLRVLILKKVCALSKHRAIRLHNGRHYSSTENSVAWPQKNKFHRAPLPGCAPFAIITTDANEMVAEIHDRMPLILAPNDYARWLGEEPDPHDLMRPFPAEPMRTWPISTRVNKPENDDPSIVEPIELSAA